MFAGPAATPPDGTGPDTRLAQDASGNLYGATQALGDGSCSSCGAVFKIAPDNTEQLINTFNDALYATSPARDVNEVTVGADGYLYGTVNSGGPYGCGTVYRMTSTGAVDTTFGFVFGSTTGDGCNPNAGLLLASDGNFYGTTAQSPTSVQPAYGGTVFRITPQGQLTTIHQFVNSLALPQSTLVQGNDGSLYGLTEGDGAAHAGSIYRIAPDGTFSTVYSFSGYTDDSFPIGNLVFGTDGNLYGSYTTYTYALVRAGYVFFKLTLDGEFTKLLNGSSTTVSALLPDNNGNFYVTTESDGANNLGTVSRFVPGTADVLPSVSLTASPTTITDGDGTTISWSSTNASQCIGRGAAGFWNPSNATSGSYQFTASGPGTATLWLLCGSDPMAGVTPMTTRAVTITVLPKPPAVSLTVSPTSIAAGSQAVLSWTGTSVTACTASGAWSDSQPTSGLRGVAPTVVGTDTYTLTCTAIDGNSVSVSATLTVTPPPSPTLSISASPFFVALGTPAELTWQATATASCTASGAWTGSEPTSGTQVITQRKPGFKTYALTCLGLDGTKIRRAAYVWVY